MKDKMDKSDNELMVLYQKGNEAAFEELYRRHSGRVYGFLKNRVREADLVDDIFQATFMKLHSSKESFDPSLDFNPWLFTVCKTVLFDTMRKKKKQVELSDFDVSEMEIDGGVEGDSHTQASLPDLSELPEPQRQAIELRYSKDLSFDEIAKRLNTSPSNVRQIISRGVKRLKELMTPKGLANEE